MRLQGLCRYMIILCFYLVKSLEHEKSFFLQDGASNVLDIGIYQGSLLVTASNDVIQKDIETGVLQRTFRAHDKTVYSFVVTNDSRMITSGYDDMIVVWDLVTGSILKRIWLRISDTRIERLAVKNNVVIAGGLDNRLRQVDLISGRIIRTTELDGYVYSVAVGDEYFYVGKQTSPNVLRYLIQGGTSRMIFDGHTNTVFALHWSNDILVSGGADTNVICWNARNGNIIRILSGHNDDIYAVGLFEGFVYSAGQERIVIRWNIESGQILKKFDDVHAIVIKCFTYRPSELFTGSIDTSVIRWDAISGEFIYRYTQRIKKLRAVAAWKNYVMSSGEDVEINIWDASIDSIEPVAVITNHNLAINCLTVYDDFLYSGSSDKTVKQWNLQNFTLNKIYVGYPLTIVSLTADQSFVYASGFARAIYQWNASSSALAGRLEGHSDDVNTLELSSSMLLSGSRDQTVRVWNLLSRQTVQTINSFDPINEILITEDLLVAGTVDGIQSFSLTSGETLVYLEEFIVCGCVISLGNRIFSGHPDGIIRVRDLNTLTVLELYQGHSDFVFALCFDSSFNLYSTGFDGSIKKWNMVARKVAYSFENRFSSVTALAADEHILLVGLRGGGIISYNIEDSFAFNAIFMNKQSITFLLTLNGSVYGSSQDGLLVKFPSTVRSDISTVYKLEAEPLRSLTFNSRNLIILSGENKAVFLSHDQVVKTADLQETLVCIGATENSLLAGSRSGAVFSWSIATLEFEFELKGHLAQVNYILLESQRLFSASDDKTIIEWSLQDKSSVKIYQRLSASALGHLGSVNALSYCFGSLFSAGSDLAVRRWNTQTGRHEDVYFGFSKAVTTVLCHNSSIFAGSEDFAVLMFRPSFNSLTQATTTSSRAFLSTRKSRLTRLVQRSQSIGSNSSHLLSIIIGAIISIIFLISLTLLIIYRKPSASKQSPELNSSSAFDSSVTATDLRTVVNSVMGISKHAAYLIPSSMIAGIRKLASGGGGELLIAKIMDPALQKKFGDTIIQKIVFIRNKANEEAFFQEVGIMIMLSSFPHFCKIIGYTENPLSLILKFYSQGSLSEWLHNSKGQSRFDVKLLKELAKALSIMHSHFLAHCDIKPQNILMQVDSGVPSCYLTDFGITQILSDEVLASKAFNVINLRGLSVIYASPEAFTNFKSKVFARVDFTKYDIYSFACVILEVITRKIPWT